MEQVQLDNNLVALNSLINMSKADYFGPPSYDAVEAMRPRVAPDTPDEVVAKKDALIKCAKLIARHKLEASGAK